MSIDIDALALAKAEGLQAAMRAAAAIKAAGNHKKPLRQIGGLRALAELLGISASAVSSWRGEAPISRALQIEAATGVSRHLLRPDYWSAPADGVTSLAPNKSEVVPPAPSRTQRTDTFREAAKARPQAA